MMFISLAHKITANINWDKTLTPNEKKKDPNSQETKLTPKSEKNRTRFIEDFSLIPVYIILTIFELSSVVNSPWFLQPFEAGWTEPSVIKAYPTIDFLYDFYIAFYSHTALMLIFHDQRRGDFVTMLIHHIITLTLVIGSRVAGYWIIGSVIMCCHDLVDVLLFSSVSMNYITRNKAYAGLRWITYTLFGTFALSYFGLRIVMYSIPVYHAVLQVFFVDPSVTTPLLTTHPVYQGNANPQVGGLMISCLIILGFFHLKWFGMIIQMIVRIFKQGENAEDVRDKSE